MPVRHKNLLKAILSVEIQYNGSVSRQKSLIFVLKTGPLLFREYYINSKGEKKYPWLQGLFYNKRPNKSLVVIVAVSKYTELTGNPSSYYPINGKNMIGNLCMVYIPQRNFSCCRWNMKKSRRLQIISLYA